MNIKKQIAARRSRWKQMTPQQRLLQLQQALEDFLNYVQCKREKRGETLCTHTTTTTNAH